MDRQRFVQHKFEGINPDEPALYLQTYAENGVNLKNTFADISMKADKVITKFIKIIRE